MEEGKGATVGFGGRGPPQTAAVTGLDTRNPGTKLMSKWGWVQGQGLGKHLDGIVEPVGGVRLATNEGIGYMRPAHAMAAWATEAVSVWGMRDQKYKPDQHSCTQVEQKKAIHVNAGNDTVSTGPGAGGVELMTNGKTALATIREGLHEQAGDAAEDAPDWADTAEGEHGGDEEEENKEILAILKKAMASTTGPHHDKDTERKDDDEDEGSGSGHQSEPGHDQGNTTSGGTAPRGEHEKSTNGTGSRIGSQRQQATPAPTPGPADTHIEHNRAHTSTARKPLWKNPRDLIDGALVGCTKD